MSEPKDESFVEQVHDEAEQLAHEVSADTAVLSRAIGGVRGAIDSGLPSVVFLIAYFANDRNLRFAIYCAVAVGIFLAMISLVQRKSLQQVVSGLFGLAISAFITAKTGAAQNFFLPGIIRNGIYGAAFLISIWFKRPLLGYFFALLRTSENMKESAKSELVVPAKPTDRWQDDPVLFRRYSTATWAWTLMFLGRFVIMLPLWLVGATGALGVASLVLGYPLFALVIYFSYLILRDKPLKLNFGKSATK